ncbi:TPA: hypothetical protein VPD84_000203 [Streptococcus pyogenes]|uniref:hypothetical protein n=1 Tax=Streptococcus dysgalactiae TaxID=1334 RepID=UPI00197F167C|nr:hypothetical protein [Streptococcus dysgalactiae]HES2980130.1 hypothetical protein [Streptococcus pyogenes]HES8259647.1 hypothetical protein [Streptococcus pyogenes]HES8407982.1 hypothetical protein [Streptococcus pyogenes]HES8626814.1 hypothetical protein [Streptococcus pyogenes]HES8633191.1 hypothetical protein [Streptococcus pyogenes]
MLSKIDTINQDMIMLDKVHTLFLEGHNNILVGKTTEETRLITRYDHYDDYYRLMSKSYYVGYCKKSNVYLFKSAK